MTDKNENIFQQDDGSELGMDWQYKPVQVDIIYAESEEDIVSVLKQKRRQYEKLSQKMQAIVKRYGLSENAIANELRIENEASR